MSSRFGNMSEELFQILKGTGKILTLFDSQGRKVYEPSMARKFFAEPDKMMISVNEDDVDSSINLYLSQAADLKIVASIINTLRAMSSRYNVILDVKKYGKELSPKDFAYQTIGEAAMWGSTKTSYQQIGNAKLVVRHCSPVREDVMGSRGRNILSMFVETKAGERLKFPVCHLSGARAWAKHLAEGGSAYDGLGSYIVEISQEASDLTKVARYVQHSRKTLAEDAQSVRTPLRNRVAEIRKELQSIGRPRGYTMALESKAYENKTTIKEDRYDTVELECQRLRELLDIDTNHALAETIRSVALITLGENIMTIDTTKFSQVLALESVDDLIEALSSEYGLLENNHWVRHDFGLAILPEAADDITGYLDLSESAYELLAEGDAFTNFASEWFGTRKANSGQEGESPEDRDDRKSQQKIDDLADGLRAINNGERIADVDLPDEMPGFADERSEARYKLGLYLDAGAAMQNDSLWTWISSIVDKLQDDKRLSPIEHLMSRKLVNSLDDDTNEAVQVEDDIMEYGDYTSYSAGAQADSEENAEAEVYHDFEKGGAQAFIDEKFPELNGPCDQDEPLSTSELQGELNSYLGKEVADILGRDYYDLDDEMTRDLMPPIIKIAQSNGWTFDAPLSESEVTSFDIGDLVATDFGPGEVVEVDSTQVKVMFQHGGSKIIAIGDVEKVDTTDYVHKRSPLAVKEMADMEAWFEQFDPQSILAAPTVPMEEAAEPMYHSVFFLMDDGIWGHHFDADSKEDAQAEVDSLRNNGEKTKVFKVAQSEANWGNGPGQVKPDDFVRQKLGTNESEITEQAATPSYFEGGEMGMNDAHGFVDFINSNHGHTLAGIASDIIEGDHYHEMNENALKFIADIADHQGESSLEDSIRNFLSGIEESSHAGDMGDDFIADVKKDDDEDDIDNEVVSDLAFLRRPQNETLKEAAIPNRQFADDLDRLRLLSGLKK
jgi:hypothetical protein